MAAFGSLFAFAIAILLLFPLFRSKSEQALFVGESGNPAKLKPGIWVNHGQNGTHKFIWKTFCISPAGNGYKLKKPGTDGSVFVYIAQQKDHDFTITAGDGSTYSYQGRNVEDENFIWWYAKDAPTYTMKWEFTGLVCPSS